MPEHQGIEKGAKIAKKIFLTFYLSGVDSLFTSIFFY